MTSNNLRQEITTAIDKIEMKSHLAGLNEAILQVRSFRLAAEASATGSEATSMILFRADRLIDDLETGAALLKKQIGG